MMGHYVRMQGVDVVIVRETSLVTNTTLVLGKTVVTNLSE
jgi:hypothetical protein